MISKTLNNINVNFVFNNSYWHTFYSFILILNAKQNRAHQNHYERIVN